MAKPDVQHEVEQFLYRQAELLDGIAKSVVIVEAALMGMPILVHDLGSMATFGEEIGNKIKYASSRDSLVTALDRLVEHLSGPPPDYHIRLYSKRNYIAQLRRIMGLHVEVPVVHDDVTALVS